MSVVGTDDLWMQSVHGSHRYLHPDIAWGKRLVDIITEEPNAIVLDLNRFHDIEPAA